MYKNKPIAVLMLLNYFMNYVTYIEKNYQYKNLHLFSKRKKEKKREDHIQIFQLVFL